MRPRKWTEEQLREAARQSTSIRKVLFILGLKQAGGKLQTNSQIFGRIIN